MKNAILIVLAAIFFNGCSAKTTRRSPRRLGPDDDGALNLGCKGSPKGGAPFRYIDCNRDVREFLEVQNFFCFGTDEYDAEDCLDCLVSNLPAINKKGTTDCSVFTSPALCEAAFGPCFDECSGCEDIATEVIACQAAGLGNCDGALPCQCSS